MERATWWLTGPILRGWSYGSKDKDPTLSAIGALVAGRNHRKVFRRELERASQVHSFMDTGSPFPFGGILGGADREEKPD